MSDREESPERQENGSNHSNDERQRDSGSPRRSLSRSRSRRRHHSRSKSSPRDKRSPYEGGSYKGDRESRGGGRDGTKYRDNYRRSHSRSPMSSRRRHQGSRENPPAGRCLGIFGLSIYTQERDLHDVLSKYGPIDDVQIVYDAQTGRSRGFCFVYFKNSDDAKMAKERCNGIEIDGRKIRVDYSITQRAHTPTPGIYMGKPT
ncbi:transformer 2-like isoform D, partial [Leptotrombidium deliense]